MVRWHNEFENVVLIESGQLRWDGLHLSLGGVRIVTVAKKHRWYSVKWTNGKELNLSRREFPDDKHVKHYILHHFMESSRLIKDETKRAVVHKKFREFLEATSEGTGEARTDQANLSA